ncbi:hypothetical protein ST47_g150 [Ascochyta rabiei]|uniref:Uncharacterized protein n=1 Tax=Didymella rabiei TaxID=5454 RepID=A0A163MG61_DIDRA|nr:hypothetical protein ST47_g150 [Ascochyta rabiei]
MGNSEIHFYIRIAPKLPAIQSNLENFGCSIKQSHTAKIFTGVVPLQVDAVSHQTAYARFRYNNIHETELRNFTPDKVKEYIQAIPYNGKSSFAAHQVSPFEPDAKIDFRADHHAMVPQPWNAMSNNKRLVAMKQTISKKKRWDARQIDFQQDVMFQRPDCNTRDALTSMRKVYQEYQVWAVDTEFASISGAHIVPFSTSIGLLNCGGNQLPCLVAETAGALQWRKHPVSINTNFFLFSHQSTRITRPEVAQRRLCIKDGTCNIHRLKTVFASRVPAEFDRAGLDATTRVPESVKKTELRQQKLSGLLDQMVQKASRQSRTKRKSIVVRDFDDEDIELVKELSIPPAAATAAHPPKRNATRQRRLSPQRLAASSLTRKNGSWIFQSFLWLELLIPDSSILRFVSAQLSAPKP